MEKVKSSWKEKIFYAFGNMGGYILWAFIGTYVTIYVTECLKPGDDLIRLLGTIILVCRFFDAGSDILMGLLIEKTHSKAGKARLWFGISILPLTIVFFFIFFLSGLDSTASIIVISVLYFLFTVIFYTMNNIAFNAMLPRLSNDPYDQSNICTFNSVFTSVGGLVTAIAIPVLKAFGGEDSQNSWTYFVLILAIIALIGMSLCFFFVHEKKEIVVETRQPSRSDLRKGLAALFRTPYFYIAILMFTINYFISLSVIGIGKYYAQYVLNNEMAFTYFGIFPMFTMGLGLLLTPILVKAWGKKNTLVAAVSCVALGNLIGSCFTDSYVASFVGVMVKGLGSAVVMSQLFTLAPDLVRYIEAKTGLRVEGLAASANSFGQKIGSGFGTAAVLWALAGCGYVTGADSQNESTLLTFKTFYWWVPFGLSVILIALAASWNIEKKTKAIEEKKAASALGKEKN
jgi:GPH family glycoside/pentoside/hexuronide:cation symporter